MANFSLSNDISNWALAAEPTPAEYQQRLDLYNLLYTMTVQHWDRGPFTFELFGSCRTGLLLPSSDIDVVILDGFSLRNPSNSMSFLTRKLQRSGLFREVFFVRGAKVPIIKVRSKTSQMTADISCNVRDGVDGSQFLLECMAQIPSFKPIFLVVKSMLAYYDLNDAANGGMGSFALSVMLLTYLRVTTRKDSTLGELLLGFFDYFGNKFDSSRNAINFRVPNGIAPRNAQYSKHDVVVENPNKANHNTSAACRKWYMVQQLFQAAADSINRHSPMNNSRPFHSFKRADFGPYPVLCVLNSLHRFLKSRPVKVKDYRDKVAQDMRDNSYQDNRQSKDVITIDAKDTKVKKAEQVITIDSDTEDYDTISHIESKKRKRDGEANSDSEKKQSSASPKTTSSSYSAPNSPAAPTSSSSSTSTSTSVSASASTPSADFKPAAVPIPTSSAPLFTPTPIPSAQTPPLVPLASLPPSKLKFSKKQKTGDNTNTTTTITTTTTTSTSTDDNDTPKDTKNKKGPAVTKGFMEPFNLPVKLVPHILNEVMPKETIHCSFCKKQYEVVEDHLTSKQHMKKLLAAGIFV